MVVVVSSFSCYHMWWFSLCWWVVDWMKEEEEEEHDINWISNSSFSLSNTIIFILDSANSPSNLLTSLPLSDSKNEDTSVNFCSSRSFSLSNLKYDAFSISFSEVNLLISLSHPLLIRLWNLTLNDHNNLKPDFGFVNVMEELFLMMQIFWVEMG